MIIAVRTTVTLDPDVTAFLQRSMHERGLTFKQALNEAIRAGMTIRSPGEQQTFPTFDMGEPLIDLTKALRLAGELEDDELVGRIRRGS